MTDFNDILEMEFNKAYHQGYDDGFFEGQKSGMEILFKHIQKEIKDGTNNMI